MLACTITVNGYKVEYHSDRELQPAFAALTRQEEFQDWQVTPGASHAPYTISYHRTSRVVEVKYGEAGAQVFAPWERIRYGETLLYAALPFIERQQQEHGYVTAHAACVATSAGAVVLLGKEGAGKTVTALSLCRDYGAQLIGNDLINIGINRSSGQVTVRGGTKFIFLRYESVRRSLPELLNHFPNDHNDRWLRKTKVLPGQLGIQAYTGEMPLRRAFLVHIDDTQERLFVQAADGLVTRLYLNENFSRYIRGGSISLFDPAFSFLGYVPSLDAPHLFETRVQLMEKLIQTPPMLYVSGRVSDVAAFIAS